MTKFNPFAFTTWAAAIALSVLLASSPANAQSASLNVGDPAPKLDVKEYLKGDKVESFEKGQTYVVEFWATWCGPCRVSIPHLTDLQKKYPKVTFIGVSVWENDAKAVAPFVKEMGEKMDYRVAVDNVPKDGEANEGAMAKNWMSAAGEDGIPAAFIINGEGKIAWIGHPMQMDKTLEEVIAGKYDIAAARADRARERAAATKLAALGEKVREFQKSKDFKGMIAMLDEAIKDEPSLEKTIGVFKFMQLVQGLKDEAKATEYGTHLVEKVFQDDDQSLNNLAWSIVDPGAGKKFSAYVPIALKAAHRANELTKGENGPILDTLGKAYFDSGDIAKAIEIQEKAVKLMDDDGLRERLETYRKALKEKDKDKN